MFCKQYQYTLIYIKLIMPTYLQDEISSDYKDQYRYLYTYCLLVVGGYELPHSFNIIDVLILSF